MSFVSGVCSLGTASTWEGVEAHMEGRQPEQKIQKFQRPWASPECGMGIRLGFKAAVL